jgi:hypothetical protein
MSEESKSSVWKTAGRVMIAATIMAGIAYGLYKLERRRFRQGVLSGSSRFRLLTRDRKSIVTIGSRGEWILAPYSRSVYDQTPEDVFRLVPTSKNFAIETRLVSSRDGTTPLFMTPARTQAGMEMTVQLFDPLSASIAPDIDPGDGDTVRFLVGDNRAKLVVDGSTLRVVDPSSETPATSFDLEPAFS